MQHHQPELVRFKTRAYSRVIDRSLEGVRYITNSVLQIQNGIRALKCREPIGKTSLDSCLVLERSISWEGLSARKWAGLVRRSR